jgi:hypothetical protein
VPVRRRLRNAAAAPPETNGNVSELCGQPYDSSRMAGRVKDIHPVSIPIVGYRTGRVIGSIPFSVVRIVSSDFVPVMDGFQVNPWFSWMMSWVWKFVR